MEIGELVVVQTEKTEQSDMYVPNVMSGLHRFRSDFVRSPHRMACVNASAGKPHGHGSGIMVSAVCGAAIANAVVGAAPELPAPNDKGFIEESALLQIGDESGDGLIDAFDARPMGSFDKVVGVPPSIVGLYEANAFFDKPPCQEQFAAKWIRFIVSNTYISLVFSSS